MSRSYVDRGLLHEIRDQCRQRDAHSHRDEKHHSGPGMVEMIIETRIHERLIEEGRSAIG